MDNYRLILGITLAFLFFMIWKTWQEDYGTPPPTPNQIVQEKKSVPIATTGVPEVSSTTAPPSRAGDLPVQTPSASTVSTGEELVTIKTDLLNLVIDTQGGDIRQAELLNYPIAASQKDKPVQLLYTRENRLHTIQTGLLASQGKAPDHHAKYRSDQPTYTFADNQNSLSVPLTWSQEGVEVTKIFQFRRDSYDFTVTHRLNNLSQSTWQGRQYRQIQRTPPGKEESSFFIYTYTGGVISTSAKRYEKLSFDTMAKADLNREVTGGWMAMIQHYFLSALIPQPGEMNIFYSKTLNENRHILGMYTPEVQVAAGQQRDFISHLYIGPKLQDKLEMLAEGLELTADYGYLTFIAKPLYWLLESIHKLFGNWGIAIILLTVTVKLAFYKLSEASYRSMARLKKVQPMFQRIREQYADDSQRMNQEIMELYRREKVNPLGGCLPILVQMPVFIALYWVLLESVGIRQAPFAFWIQDLSAHDPYYILPVIMAVSMFIQQKLNPPPPDPLQEKILLAMPLAFGVFFAFFPAGLVLYWVVNNLLSILQQWYITKTLGQEGGGDHSHAGKGKLAKQTVHTKGVSIEKHDKKKPAK